MPSSKSSNLLSSSQSDVMTSHMIINLFSYGRGMGGYLWAWAVILFMVEKLGTEGLFIYYVSMNNQWSIFKKMTKDDGEGLRVIR